ncbi:MAG: chromate efflux transporter [Thermodesulfobacteriota bacterium]|nr:chromate efflux transporter [Thermodesulfobacteriota bacterium]
MKDSECQQVEQHPSLTHLFTSFLRLGATAFGGPAMVAYIRKMAVDQKHWLDEKTARDGIALCQTIPGATAMQMSAYIGFRVRGVGGAAASFIGFGLPAFLFMMILSALYARTHTLPSVVSIFNGLQAIVVALVANATLSFGRTSIKSWKNVINVLIAAGLFGLRINPILVIIISAFLGMILYNKQPLSPAVGTMKKEHAPKSLLLIVLVTAIGFTAFYFLDRKLFDLATLMFRIDLFAFGGGFASVPLMFHEVVEVRRWMDGPTLLNGIAMGQVTPGPIVITATFMGYLLHGFLGGLVATVSVFLPSFMIVIAIVPYFDRMRNSPYFNRVLIGILCSFVGLLLTVTVRFASNIPWDLPRLLIAGGAFVALLMKVDILWVVLIGTGISLVVL